MKLDHFAWAFSSLDDGIREFQKFSGVTAVHGGSHAGQGSRNALVSLGANLYLAMDGPDPAQNQVGTYGEVLSTLAGPDLNVFAVATEDMETALEKVVSFGLLAKVVRKSRVRPDGITLDTSVLEIERNPFGKAMPHILQWHTPHHPGKTSPNGCRFANFIVEHPEHDKVADFYSLFGLDVEIRKADHPRLWLTLEGAYGRFKLPTL
jgi:hypothetical protein